jgi:hypothetical protein
VLDVSDRPRRSKAITTRAVTARLVLGAALLGLAGCGTLAVWFAPDKTPSSERRPQAARADELFWRVLHAGAYDRIPEALTALKAAYVADPGDAVTAAHIGWLHIWRLSERARLPGGGGPDITDDAALSRKYFEEAVRLAPGEARYLGFYAGAMLAEGSIHKDERLLRRGYFTLKDAIAAWPEFNAFTAGYIAGLRPHDSSAFHDGLALLWENIDVCVGERVDRANPDYARYMRLETKAGPKRVCWNSWIAPHNVEGFFLHFGDMLVKAGDPARAVTMYANARLAAEFPSWPYRDALERRIVDAAANVEAFRRPDPPAGGPAMMVRSRYACVGCHQQ